MDRYRPRGRVDSDLGIEMGYGCRELYQRERERESFIRKNENQKWVPRERERELSEKKKRERKIGSHRERERESFIRKERESCIEKMRTRV